VPPELGLILSPHQTYAALARTPRQATLFTALRRPLLVALVLGMSVTMAATNSVSPVAVASITVSWSYVVVLQLAIALAVVAGPARRTVGLARAVDLFFAGHAPWSLFVLLTSAWDLTPKGWPIWPLYLSALAPCLLTVRIVRAFFAEVLALDAGAALRRTIVHQAITWTVFVAINWAASAFTPRVLEAWSRLSS